MLFGITSIGIAVEAKGFDHPIHLVATKTYFKTNDLWI
jgi:hypothetical protein